MSTIIRRTHSNPSAPMRNAEWDPFQVMQDLLRWELPRQTASGAPAIGDERLYAPDFEVKETKDAYLFQADLPGVKEGDLDITLSGNTLTVNGKREAQTRQEGETYYAYERSFGSFTRSFTLPEAADADNIKADLRDGVLSIVLPKKPEMQPRRITVRAGEGSPKDKQLKA